MNLRCFNPQFYIASRVGDSALERGDISRTAGYRRQLGIVIAAVKVLRAAVPADDLLPGDRLALDRFAKLAEPPESLTGRDWISDATLTSANVDDLIRKLRRLRQDDPRSADEVVRRLTDEASGAAVDAVTS